MSEQAFLPLAIAVLTVSDTRTEADDASGRILVERLTAAGHHLAKRICFSGALLPKSRTGVAATPGLDFGSNAPEKHIRFAYTTGVPRLAEAVERLRRYFGR